MYGSCIAAGLERDHKRSNSEEDTQLMSSELENETLEILYQQHFTQVPFDWSDPFRQVNMLDNSVPSYMSNTTGS